MKIMLVISGMTSGGAERVMATLANEFAKTDKVRLIILKDNKTDYEISNKVEIKAGNIKHKNPIKASIFVKKQLEEFKPDIILSFMTKNNIISIIARELSKYKCPVVISERANPYFTPKVFSLIRRYVYKKADGCVFQTKWAQDYYKNILKCDSKVIRNPLSRDFNIKPYTGERKNKIVCTARLSSEKNQAFLIKTFDQIKDKYPEFKLEIFGEGPERENLQLLIDQLKLNDRAYLMGRKQNIIDYIQDASIFVLPSNSEGMPNSLLEAMALGIPSISTDCPIGGPAVIIRNNENGILVPMNDQKELINAIEKILNDKGFANKISANGIMIVNDFETEKICEEWILYLRQVVKEKN